MSFVEGTEAKSIDTQNITKQDFTIVRCGQKTIDDQCLCLPKANWQTWRTNKRLRLVRGKNSGREAWHILLLFDDDDVIHAYYEALGGCIECNRYGEVLKSGWGREPSEDTRRAVVGSYDVYEKINKIMDIASCSKFLLLVLLLLLLFCYCFLTSASK